MVADQANGLDATQPMRIDAHRPEAPPPGRAGGEARRTTMKMWVKWLILGILSILFGLFVLANPVAASIAVTTLAGILFAVAGGFQILFSDGHSSSPNDLNHKPMPSMVRDHQPAAAAVCSATKGCCASTSPFSWIFKVPNWVPC